MIDIFKVIWLFIGIVWIFCFIGVFIYHKGWLKGFDVCKKMTEDKDSDNR